MPNHQDPLGYYQILGVPINASADAIKKAYRQLAMELHPDRNPSVDTTKRFQSLQNAYDVLSNPIKRSLYDAQGFGSDPGDKGRHAANEVHEPIRCYTCNCVSAQPRYIIFYSVVSYIFATTRTPAQGVYCAACAAKEALFSSALTWAVGWWGFPWGPFYSISTIYRNLLGGLQPPDQNAQLLLYQAYYFARANKRELARSIAKQALAFAEKDVKEVEFLNQLGGNRSRSEVDKTTRAIKDLLRNLDDGSRARELKSQWGLTSKLFIYQATIIATIVLGLITWRYYEHTKTQERINHHKGTLEKNLPNVQSTSPPKVVAPLIPVNMPKSGEIYRLNQLDPQSQNPKLQVITDPSGPNYFIKLQSNDSKKVALTAFIKAGDTVLLQIPVGAYSVKFASGSVWYGTKFLFGDATDYSRIKDPLIFSIEDNQTKGHSLTLKSVLNGNLKRQNISPNDF